MVPQPDSGETKQVVFHTIAGLMIKKRRIAKVVAHKKAKEQMTAK